MGTAVMDGAAVHDGDVDVSYVAQLSSVGALADEVLADLIKAEAHLTATSESAAIRRAADLFGETVKAAERPATLRIGIGLADALRRMAAAPHDGTNAAPRESSIDWLNSLKSAHAALASAGNGEAGPNEIDLLKAFFANIAAGTMDATLGAVHPRSYASSWLTA